MILLIDQGNSSNKWCLAEKDKFCKYNSGLLPDLDKFISDHSKDIKSVYLASVKNEQQIECLTKVINNHLNIETQVATSKAKYCLSKNHILKNAYKTSEQLGIDRWLAMVAIYNQTKKGFIVVDAGSALTLDVVDNSGQHLGGHIIPGLSMQKKLLSADTDKVLFESNSDASAFRLGCSTSEAVHNGCLSTLCSYIAEMYNYHNGKDSLPLILTGGDADALSKTLTVDNIVQKHLVLNGLYFYMVA
ncbi:MAG: type III pantothenate kinase [Gammaproteobacteria bacterium]|nr:type III pantothenate kinase [Gammaproteobacteria bacterium]